MSRIKELETSIAQMRVNQRYCDDSERKELDEAIERMTSEIEELKREQVPPPDSGPR